jgi:hypothetical protein
VATKTAIAVAPLRALGGRRRCDVNQLNPRRVLEKWATAFNAARSGVF